MSHDSSSSSILPWIVMGLSMGVGYFGVESLVSWYSTSQKRTQRNAFLGPLERQLQQINKVLSLSDAKTWLLRVWTLPLLGNYYDVFTGFVVAILPRSEGTEADINTVLTTAMTTTTSTEKSPSTPTPESPPSSRQQKSEVREEGDLFLTLPPQLHPRLGGGLPPKVPPKQQAKKERYLEMLLHNVSHTDLVLGLDVLLNSNEKKSSAVSLNAMCLSRPRFSAFDMYCRKLLQALQHQQQTEEEAEIVLVPQYQRSQNDPRKSIIQPADRPHISTGFCWKQRASTQYNPRVFPLTEALADLRVRGKDVCKLDPYKNTCSPDTTTAMAPSEPEASGEVASGEEADMVATDAPVSPNSGTSSWNMVATDAPLSKEAALVELKAVFFPLLATLLPRWHAQIAQKYSQHSAQVNKVLVLVTGVGTPRNWTHSITGNSTQALADLMELFLAKVYPDITVVKIHSDTNIFRYDDNIAFVQQELMPTVNAYRDAHATQAPYPHEQQPLVPTTTEAVGSALIQPQLQPRQSNATTAACNFDVDWKKSFAVTLSFADGSPARTHAIQTALRIFRPTYFHIWQLKTFWHERKIVDDDVEVHSFEEMETSPALESNDLQGQLAAVVSEMKAFRQEMTETLLSNQSDIHSFWLRKTHKPVLAVLLVQSAGEAPVLYRGTNMEVSMPTGSLCAERNVIGTALASNPKLKREDLKCIAVLAVPQPKTTTSNGRPHRSSIGSASDICGTCRPSSSRRNSFEESAAIVAAAKAIRRDSFDEREEDWMLNYATQEQQKTVVPTNTQGGTMTEVVVEKTQQQQEQPSTPMRRISLFSSESSNSLIDMIKQSPPGGNNSTTTAAAVVKETTKRTVIVRSNNQDVDLNPLRPCGACHEWLKKIAECNPYFQICTFTDADCTGVYVTPCQE